MTADMNAILVGYRGTRDLLDSIFGKSETKPEPTKPLPKPVVQVVNQSSDNLPKLTPTDFDRMFSGLKGKPN